MVLRPQKGKKQKMALHCTMDFAPAFEGHVLQEGNCM
jgi:hypothetical protein